MSISKLSERMDRRTLLRGVGLGTAGLVAAALIGCGDDDDDDDGGTTTPTTTPTEVPGGATDLDLGAATNFDLVAGWYRGGDTEYYDFGMNTPLLAGSGVATAPIYVFVTGFDDDGAPQFVDGQHNVIDVVPGDEGYSDLWEVHLLTVPDGYKADSITSKEEVDAAGFETTIPGLLVNCPVVPAGSTLEGGEELTQGWYRGRRVYYPDFDGNPEAAIPIWAFANGTTDDGSPAFVEGQRNIIDSVPGDGGYSAFWRVNLVMVDDAYEANTLTDAGEVGGSGFEVVQTDLVVNCPVVSPTV